jgi:hypothetical protein
MSVIFCDELSELRQRLYWEVFREEITLDEWRYACWQAMRHETFYKVPLPATMMAYVREGRRDWYAHHGRRDVKPPLRELREDPLAQAQVQALIASVWPDYPQGTQGGETPSSSPP